MKRSIALVLLLVFAMPVVAYPVFAVEEIPAGITDAGNKFCPVSGDPVSGTDFVTYKGKRYGLCCPMCEKPFLSNPEKYLASLAEKEKELSTGTDTGMHHM